MKYSLILKSAFINKLVACWEEDYDNMDLWILKMIKAESKKTIRHILIPYNYVDTWILIWIEFYSFEIQILSPKIQVKKEEIWITK